MTGALTLLQSWFATLTDAAARLAAWAAAAGASSWPLALLGALLGVALLVAGVRLGRLLGAAGGALVGWVAAKGMGDVASGALPHSAVAWGAAAVLAAASALSPSIYPLALGIVPGALLGFQVPIAGRPWLGAVVAGAVLALLGLALRRVVLAATAAGTGAVLLGASLLALSSRIPLLAALAQRPLLLAGACAVLAVAGTAYQVDLQGRHAPSADGRRARSLE